jgi:small subunit ribosomal protein S9
MNAVVKVNDKHVHAVGRRKRSTARVFLQPGSGKISVNRLAIEDYFADAIKAQKRIVEPLVAVAQDGQFDLFVTTQGGGVTGQADAIRLAVARALVTFEEKEKGQREETAEDSEENSHPWHKILRHSGMLTRDSRIVLRKLVGRRKARKKEQYSKR